MNKLLIPTYSFIISDGYFFAHEEEIGGSENAILTK